ncbi:MAG: STAS domain-containing protein [Roseiflexus sp.]
MRDRFNAIMTTRATDADVQRRALAVMQLIAAMLVANVLFLVLSLLSPNRENALIPIASSVCFIGAFVLARRGYASGAAWIVLLAFLAGALIAVANVQPELASNVGYFLTALIVIASLTLTPGQLWLVTFGVVASYLATLAITHPGFWDSTMVRQQTMNSSVLLVVIGFVSYIGARLVRRTIHEAYQARTLAERVRTELAQANAQLETRVTERTAELSQALAAQKALTEELQRSLAAQQELSQIILELSLPIIPVREGTVVVPLSGTIDSTRAAKLTESVLKTIEQRHIHTVILDITGVPIVDTQVAQALVRTAGAARLMGAETILVGTRPEVAQTLIGLGIHLGLRTAATLQEGLELQTPGAHRRNGGVVAQVRTKVLHEDTSTR